jgi:hypothetical protein
MIENVNIWLDDERDPDDHGCGGFRWFKTGEGLVSWFEDHGLGDVEILSLDHDLGSGRITGYDVIAWIEQHVANGGHAPTRIYIHTQNPVGKERMRAARHSIYRMIDERAVTQ